MATHLRTDLVLQALEMALHQRRPTDVIHHSDQGTQYTSIAFGLRCKAAGVRPSMGSVGDCFDNAMCESFFATLACELLERERFQNQAEAKMKVFDFIEGWYNPHRRHSALGYKSPVQFERAQSRAAGRLAALSQHVGYPLPGAPERHLEPAHLRFAAHKPPELIEFQHLLGRGQRQRLLEGGKRLGLLLQPSRCRVA